MPAFTSALSAALEKLVAVRAFVWLALLAVVGVATGAWTRPLTHDEANYYLPAIARFSAQWPRPDLTDYPFPGPPLALLAQAAIHRITGGDIALLRGFSTLIAAAAGLYALRRADATPRALSVLCLPFFLWNAYTLKHHCLLVGLSLLAVDAWRAARSGRARPALAAGLCGAAAASVSQLACPLIAAFGCELLGDQPIRKRWRWLAVLAPAVVTAFYLTLWGGAQPPSYRDQLLESQVATLRFAPAQFAIGLLVVGFWLAPFGSGWPRSLRTAAFLFLPAAGLTIGTRLFAAGTDFWLSAQGPVSWLIRGFARSSDLLCAALAAVPVAAGAAWLFINTTRSDAERWARALPPIYLATTAFAVPYLFESYYLPLVTVMLWAQAEPHTAGSRVWRTLLALAGLGYALVKLRAA